MADKYSFLVIKYPKTETAMEAMGALQALAKEKVVKLKDVAAITKNENGKIKLHQTKDDPAGKGLLKGGLIGILFAAVLGPPGWIVAGAALGTAFAMFDRGIKNKLLKELGEDMTPSQSAVAILVEQADWPKAVESMKAHNFQGVIVISEIVDENMVEIEKLLEDQKTVASVPEEIEVPAPKIKKLEYIEGIGSAYAQKLNDAGITNVDELLEKGTTSRGRKEIAKETGISETLIQRWVNMADLYRVKGIGQEYAELLGAAEVDTVPELADEDAAKLLEKMAAANVQKKMVRRLPVLSQVESWVEQAKSLPRVVTY